MRLDQLLNQAGPALHAGSNPEVLVLDLRPLPGEPAQFLPIQAVIRIERIEGEAVVALEIGRPPERPA